MPSITPQPVANDTRLISGDQPHRFSPAPIPSHLRSVCHPLIEQASNETHEYFTGKWVFSSLKARNKFVKQQTPSLSCLLFPKTLDDRLVPVCKLITLVFLTDDAIDYMSIEDAFAYNGKIMQLMHGDRHPDPSIPFEVMMDHIANNFRAHDQGLAVEVLEATFELMRAQVDKQRLNQMGLQEYFDFRIADVGNAMLMSLIRFGMGLHLTADEFEFVKVIEENCSKHITTINDIYSYEKEILAAKDGDEGGAMVSAVPIVMDIAGVDSKGAKRVLWSMCREWEVRHLQLVDDLKQKNVSSALTSYLDSLEYLMAGNEVWSNSTLRYSDIKPA